MAKKPRSKPKNTTPEGRHPLHPELSAPGTNSKQAHTIHAHGLPSAIYAQVISKLLGGREDADARLYARDAHERMAPKDPVEEMLVTQMILTHARVMHLTGLLGQQTTGEGVRTICEYTDRASNTYRRLMLALSEYRRPPRTGDTFAVVKQANIANQQVVQNHEIQKQNATNEQGSDDAGGARAEPSRQAPALPSDTGRDGLAEILRSKGEAVGEVHGTEDN